MTLLTKDRLVRLCRARDQLRDTGVRPLPLRKIARQSALSPYHFIRAFKALFGETPHQVRIAARLDKARHLLITSERSVTEICTEVGFSSLSTFSQLFARRVGLPPSVYRQKARSADHVPGTMPRQFIPGCFSLICGWPE